MTESTEALRTEIKQLRQHKTEFMEAAGETERALLKELTDHKALLHLLRGAIGEHQWTLLAKDIDQVIAGSPVAIWSTRKPETPGAYWIRGWNLSGEFEQAALVQVVDEGGSLMVNLHQCTTESDTGFWYKVEVIDDEFEWSGPLFPFPIAKL